MLHQTVFNTSEICRLHGAQHVVLSPGSRNAPLIISFARNPGITKHIIPDERSAGFVALGIAQKLKEPVVLCCTSGTALLNYAPAVAEAFYREIPLIILSADRPPELIDQRDGQTIRQYDALRNHVKASVQLPVITNEKEDATYVSILESALAHSSQLSAGPVHVNIPFREPFYPSTDTTYSFNYDKKQFLSEDAEQEDTPTFNTAGKKILILTGQSPKNKVLSKALKVASQHIPVIQAPLNNLNVNGIEHVDLFLNSQNELKPDILITSGLSVLSKRVKEFLKANKPAHHFHFDEAGVAVDTYHSTPVLVKSTLSTFLSTLSLDEVDQGYLASWHTLTEKVKSLIPKTVESLPFSECKAFHQLSCSLPSGSDLHLSNSMPVRFADLFGVPPAIETWCNRGTSGIDGCTSTALGSSLVSDRLNILLTGDLSFLYDRNAFFHNYTPSNLRIVVFNNKGGGIFRLIEGPKKLPELEEYFETRHERTAEYICLENGIKYATASNEEEIAEQLKFFYEPSEETKLLEIFTAPETNEQAFKQLKQQINEHINF